MVDIADIGRISGLINERQQINNALAAFDAGARIVQFGLLGPNTEPPNMLFLVQSQYMIYPAQMLDAIKSMLTTRRNAIDDELESLGVTGVEQPPSPSATRRARR